MRTLESIYGKIPALECKRLCGGFCGPVIMSVEERERMLRVMGWEKLPEVGAGLNCPCLCQVSGVCNAYEARPLICRLWGTVQRLRCPHGCEPERWLTDGEADAIVAEWKKTKLTYGFASEGIFKEVGYGRGLKESDFTK